MPKLRKNDVHKCPLCGYSSERGNMKKHLTTAGKKGPRCHGLRVVIPNHFWENEILPFYRDDGKFPDLLQISSPTIAMKRPVFNKIKRSEVDEDLKKLLMDF